MKLLSVYELTYNGSMEEAKPRLVNQVVVETKDELAEIVSLLNSQATINKQEKDEKGKHVGYHITLSDVLPAYKFINNFVNIRDERGLVEYAKQINNLYKPGFVQLER